jgi:hypothetical protein
MENQSLKESDLEKFQTMYDHLFVTQCGRVFTKNRIKHSFSRGRSPYSCEVKGRELKTRKDKDGYLRFNTTVENKHITLLIHRLMAFTFLSKCPDGLVVDHIDRNRVNSQISNLRYVSPAVNCRNSDRQKMTAEKKEMAVKMKNIGASTAAIARSLNVEYGSVTYYFKSLVDCPHFERNVG